jgi:hypothetical protein
MSPETQPKGGQKSWYRRSPISARGSNSNGVVTRRTYFWLSEGGNPRKNRPLAKVTTVTFRPTTERALALLRGSKVTHYFPRGTAVTFCRWVVARRSTAATSVGSSPVISANMGAVT